MPTSARYRSLDRLCRRSRCLRAGIWILVATGAFSVAASPGPAEFGRLPTLESAVIAPDGRHFAALMHVEGAPYLVVNDLNATEQANRYLRLELRSQVDETFRRIHWLNNETIGVALEFDGDRRGTPTRETRLISLSLALDQGAVIPAADASATYKSQFGDQILDLLPDDPDHILMTLDRSGTGRELGVYRVHVRSGETSPVEVGGDEVADYWIDLDGEVRLRRDITDSKVRLRFREPGRNSWRRVAEADREDGLGFTPLGFDQDPSTLLVLGLNEHGHTAVYRYNLLLGRALSKVEFDQRVDVMGVQDDPYTRKILGVYHAVDYPLVHYFDKAMAEVQQKLDRALPDTYNVIENFTRDRSRYIVYSTAPQYPGTYYLYNRESDSLRILGHQHEYLKTSDLHPVEPVEYEARDGTKIKGYLTRPGGEAPYPMVVMPHGGPTARDYRRFDFMAQFLASRGYAVLQPNFRGSTGYGVDFRVAGYGQWGLLMQDDVEDGARAMIARGIADKDRLAIVGWSYGGYAALVATIKTPELFSCAVSGAGVSDIRRWLKEGQQYKFATDNPPNVGHIRKDRSKLQDNSPINGAELVQVPILLVHGDSDLSVSLSHSKKMAAKLKKAKKQHRLVILEDGDHHLSKEKHRILVLQELETFLDRHIAARVPVEQPVPD